MNLAGIDGCKAGWLMVRAVDGVYDFKPYETFAHLIIDNQQLDYLLIDIPVGLSSPGFPRTIDATMRKELKGRSSTVFNAPCRLAVYEKDYQKARHLNQQVEGKSLSIQSLAISEKIREVDEYLSSTRNRITVVESHPELCFKYLNRGIVPSKKSTKEGIAERLKIIAKYEPKLVDLYHQALKDTKRKHAKRDDIIDAICLLLVNKLGFEGHFSFLTDKHDVDEQGINIRIAYFQAR